MKTKNIKVTHNLCCCHCLVAELCPSLLWPHRLQPFRLLCPWNLPNKNTGVGCYFLLQGICPTQGLNPHLLHCRWILYPWPTKEALILGTGNKFLKFCFPCLTFPGDSDRKESDCNAGQVDSIPESGRSPGEGNGYPLQYSFLENPWTEKPGGLLSVGLQRVGEKWAANTTVF